jgi:hypothetical protein
MKKTKIKEFWVGAIVASVIIAIWLYWVYFVFRWDQYRLDNKVRSAMRVEGASAEEMSAVRNSKKIVENGEIFVVSEVGESGRKIKFPLSELEIFGV